MLHRITMRVLPALTMAVTEEGFRKRKRILMLFPGLIAFALYRGLRVPGWHADIMVLLLASGLFSMLVAMIAYTYGRGRRITQLVQDEGFASLFWIGARFGFLYSLQLSLMVLGLLKVLTYSYSEHPDGPAMMALIISSTSVSRDAFELGHLRRLQQQGRPFLGFPDAKGFWALIMRRTDLWLRPVATGALVAGSAYWMAASGFSWFQSDPGQFLIIGLLAGAAGTIGYVKGFQPDVPIRQSLTQYSWRELLKFYLWPGVAFGWTYDLILLGITSFVVVIADPPLALRTVVTFGVAGVMTLHCYYLGRCRWQEEKLHATISPSMLRCPFIFGILTSKKA